MSVYMPRNVIVIPRDVYQKCTDDFITPRQKRTRGTARKQRWNAAAAPSHCEPSSKLDQGRPNKNDLLAAMPSVASMLYNSASSPSLTSSLSSLSSSWSSSSSESPGSHRLATFGHIGSKNNVSNAVTIANNITTIHLRALAAPQKRKLSQRSSSTLATSTAPVIDLTDEDDHQKARKKLKYDTPPASPISPPCTSITRVAMPVKAREVIEISSDSEVEDIVMDAGCAPFAPSACQVSTATGTAESFHKYELEPSLRRIVDTIFPDYETHHQATLERAFATSRSLREKYVVTRYLGSGASGFVLAAKRVSDGLEVAIKVVPHTGDHVEARVQRELNIMLKLKDHANLLGCVEYFTSSLYGDVDPDDESNKDISYIVTESAACSLFDFIELHRPAQDEDASTRFKNIKDFLHTIHHVSGSQGSSPASVYESGVNEGTLYSIFTQLAKALHSMHSQCIVHGDIKDENALILFDKMNKTYRALLCDFGHSKYLAPGSAPSFPFYGTTVLAPPEMERNMEIRQQMRKNQTSAAASSASPPLTATSPTTATTATATRRQTRGRAAAANNNNPSQQPPLQHFYGYEADVWALGLTLYTMIHGDLPKEMFEKDKKHMKSIPKRGGGPRGKAANKFHFSMQNNLDADLKDLVQGMLAVDPAKRLSMNEVITHPWILRGQH
ncbi:ATP-dependent Lon protease pim1 [Mortierella antarctica]|nr:ATP-dependent Lon protease pim1 [Mortierella alpina]KAF9988691.1 ATP-dependent Lon protease pim1 [Mortierella antarctica]